MDFTDPPRRPRTESIVPMINVVFLLLIFFLMTSHLVPPEPFEVTLPEARSDTDPDTDPVLHLHKTGRLSFEQSEGYAAIAQVAQTAGASATILLRADAGLEASVLARVLRQLADAGLAKVDLIVTPK
ncbi:MAG: biopolymer transporter ExbD [Rhodobacteraceae bacterium]|nr:biopolymer transporter ExbD [Paracoccaceae bacterium]